MRSGIIDFCSFLYSRFTSGGLQRADRGFNMSYIERLASETLHVGVFGIPELDVKEHGSRIWYALEKWT